MSAVEFQGSRVMLPYCFLRSMLAYQRRQATTIDGLRKRLEARETLLTRAMHELAVLQNARDPELYVRRRTRGGAPGAH